jgi:hypothetical protein
MSEGGWVQSNSKDIYIISEWPLTLSADMDEYDKNKNKKLKNDTLSCECSNLFLLISLSAFQMCSILNSKTPIPLTKIKNIENKTRFTITNTSYSIRGRK